MTYRELVMKDDFSTALTGVQQQQTFLESMIAEQSPVMKLWFVAMGVNCLFILVLFSL